MAKLSNLLTLATLALLACSSPAEDPGVPSAAPPPTADTTPAPAAPADDGGALRLTCPTKAPFDTGVPGIAELCTRRVLIAGLLGAKLKLSSDDGATWTDAEIDPAMQDAQVFNFATGYGVVAAMTRGGIYTSTDARTWTKAPFTTDYNYSGLVVFADGRFASVGTAGTFGSADGVTWTGYRHFDQYPGGGPVGMDTGGLTFFAGQWILAGRENNKGIVRTSKDGMAWNPSTDIAAPRSGSYGSLATTKDRSLVLGASGAETEGVIATSADGSVWSEKVDKTLGLRFVVSDGSRFVGFAQNRTLTSPDGVTWSKLGDAPNLDNAVFAENTWFGCTISDYFTSADGITWKPVLHVQPANYYCSGGFARVLR